MGAAGDPPPRLRAPRGRALAFPARARRSGLLNSEVGLCAGVARRVVNPPLGVKKVGLRLFGDPIQAVESDLTATVLVVGNGSQKLAVVATDLCTMTMREADELRAEVAAAIRTPVPHVLLNMSHNHSSPGLPEYMAMTDTREDQELRRRYERTLSMALVEAAREADSTLQPARVGTAWGTSDIGAYRRELREGRYVLAEVYDHPVDDSLGVLRVDDLDGAPIAVAFRYSAHPVTVGFRSAVASADFPGPARAVLEGALGGTALFLQGCGGNVNPRVGVGWEVDCRDTKNRVGMELGGEALKVAAGIRTNTRRGIRRQLGSIPNILFTPWEPVGAPRPAVLAAAEDTAALEFAELPDLEHAQTILAQWQELLATRRATDAADWEIRLAQKYEHWAKALVAAADDGNPTCELRIQVLRIDEVAIVALNVEAFFETGLAIRERSPFRDTFVLGFSNGIVSYLPRAQDHPVGGWRVDESYAVPDLIPQASALPVILHPGSEQRAVELALDLLHRVR